MKKALYRKRICAEKEKLTPEKVFHTPQYRDLLTSIGHEITGGKLTTLRLYDDKNSGIAGWNQGETVAVNLGNQITASFLTLELKSDSLIGILGHECGHYRYTDSALRKRYAEHMLNGSWYPKEPVPENAQEKEALDAMNVHFERKDKAILSIFLQTAWNILQWRSLMQGRKPTEFLSVDKKEFRRLRDMNGGVKELKWLQLEKSTGKTIGDEEICWMVKEEFEPNDLKFVLDQMSICQIRHYLVKQSEKSGDDISHVLQVWNDYLSMAKRLGMDIHDSIIYRTRDLQLRHKEAVLKIEEMKRGIRRRELEEKYVGFQKHLIDLKEKYEFSDGEYQVIAPKSIDDILYEGDTLHHCVNKTDTYFDRIVSKESYILFLREKENPKVPFYTLEVEPDGTIRQKRAEFNRQNKDIDKVTSFLTLWQKEIQKRLTQKDRKSTEESRKLRQQNYQEIRDKHVVVHGGAFAGELLADLLEKDLMNLPVESAENEESPTEIAA